VATADGPVRFRLTAWQQLPFYFLWALILTEEAFFTFATHIRLALPVTSVLILPLVFLTRWFGVTLTPDEAIVHNLRRRRIAWRDIQTIQAERLFGNRIVVLYEASGRRTRLRAPLSVPQLGQAFRGEVPPDRAAVDGLQAHRAERRDSHPVGPVDAVGPGSSPGPSVITGFLLLRPDAQ